MLQLDNVVKSYAGGFSLAVDIAAQSGEFVSLLGPSGCGKTSLLRLIAGLEAPDSGSVIIDGTDVTALPAHLRGVGMVFQDYALFPHMTAGHNVEYGLKMSKVPREERAERAWAALELVGLPHVHHRDVTTLSGGEKQRVALARSIVTRPSILLLDEPFSALDQQVRLTLRREVRELQRRLGITMMFVTHNQEEALSLSDTVVVMSRGSVEQVGAPRETYSNPRSLYTASFLGELNQMPGTVGSAQGRDVVQIFLSGGTALSWAHTDHSCCLDESSSVFVCFRPEDARCISHTEDALVEAVRSNGSPLAIRLNGIVSDSEFLGPVTLVSVQTREGKMAVVSRGVGSPLLGESVVVEVPVGCCFVFDAAARHSGKGAVAE